MLNEFKLFSSWIITLLISSFISVKVTNWAQRKARVVCYLGQAGKFKVKNCEIATHSLVIINKGKVPAKNLQVAHINLPEFNVNPQGVVWEEKKLKNDIIVIEFPNFVSGQQVTISYLYPPEMWQHIHGEIKHDDGIVNLINVLPTEVWPKSIQLCVWFLLIVGGATTLWFIFFLFIYANDYLTFLNG